MLLEDLLKLESHERINKFSSNNTVYDSISHMLEDVNTKDKNVFVRVYQRGVFVKQGVFNFITTRLYVVPRNIRIELDIKYPNSSFIFTDYPSVSIQSIDVVNI
jgi:hypothetical protein